MQRYCLYDDLKALQRETMPVMDRCLVAIQDFTVANQQKDHIISRFDEVLLQKANKLELHAVDVTKVEKKDLARAEAETDGKIDGVKRSIQKV